MQIAAPAPTAFSPISSELVTELCTTWFASYHPWFPILHQPSLLEALQLSHNVESSSRYLVIKAILAVTVQHSQSYSSNAEARREYSEVLREAVIMEAMSHLSLQSIQALLILSNLDYGAGKMNQFWNLLSLCKR